MLTRCIFLFSSLILFSFQLGKLADGWSKIEKTKAGSEKIEIYFFDYMTKLEKINPSFAQLKGREFTNALQEVQFQFPTYVAKRDLNKGDSVEYFILRPNKTKSNQPNYYDLEVVKAGNDFPLDSLEIRSNYEDKIIRITSATACRGSLVYEHNLLIQKNPDKDKLIGNGIQITEGIFTRVIPFEEIKRPFLRLIESNL